MRLSLIVPIASLLALGASFAQDTNDAPLQEARTALLDGYRDIELRSAYLDRLSALAVPIEQVEDKPFPERTIDDALIEIAAHRAARLDEFRAVETQLGEPPPRSPARDRKPLWGRVFPTPEADTPEARSAARLLWEHAYLTPGALKGAKDHVRGLILSLNDPRSIPVILHHFHLITSMPAERVEDEINWHLQQRDLRAVAVLASRHSLQDEALPLLLDALDRSEAWHALIPASERYLRRLGLLGPALFDADTAQAFSHPPGSLAAWRDAAMACDAEPGEETLAGEFLEALRTAHVGATTDSNGSPDE